MRPFAAFGNSVRKLCAAAIALTAPFSASATEIIAHRGASHDAPENTLPAVLLGWERGADSVEIDIHHSRDGRIVAIHDKDTKRVTGHTGLVASMSFSQLRELDAGSWKEPRWAGTRIPSLEEVLETVPPGKSLVVEIKCPATVLPDLERVLAASPNGGRSILIAFDYGTIAEAKRRMPHLPAYWLYGFSDREATRYRVQEPGDLLDRVRKAGLDGLDVRHDGPWVKVLAESLRATELSLFVYTVNDPNRARQLRDLGVAGITTDRPAYLRKALNGK